MANKVFEFLIKFGGAVAPSLTSATKMTKRQLRALDQQIHYADSVAWGGLTKAAKLAGMASVAAGAAVAVGLGKAAETGQEFEKHMDQWAATADATQEQYAKAREAAMLWGRKTTKTATESADALQYMALAGWDVDRSIRSLPKVLKLSEAANLDLARASSLVVDSMAATSTEAKDLPKFLDIVAKANNRSNQSAEELLEAYIKTGATLDGLHVPIEESAVAFGMLANRGKKAEEAGVGLRSVLINLTTGQGQAGKMMEKLGVSAFDANGNFIGLKNTLLRLNEATKDLSDEQRNKAFSDIGGKRQVDTLNDMMQGLNHTLADGRTEWDTLYEEVTHAEGALEQMARVRMDNLWGDVKILESALQDAGIRAYDGFSEPLRDAAQQATEAVYQFSDRVADRIATLYPTLKREAGDFKEDWIDPMIRAGEWASKHGTILLPIVTGLAGAITSFHAVVKGSDSIGKLLGKQFLLADHLKLGLGVTAAVSAITALIVRERMVAEQLKKQNLAEHFGELTLSAKELKEMTQGLFGRESYENLTKATAQLKTLRDVGREFGKANDGIVKFVGRVKDGIRLNDSELSEFKLHIDNLIEESMRAATEQAYSIRLNVEALFGRSGGEEIREKLLSVNRTLSERISEYGRELGDAYRESMEDGVIDVDEAKIIEGLQGKIAHITEILTQGKVDATITQNLAKLQGKQYSPEAYMNAASEWKESLQKTGSEYDETENELLTNLNALRSMTESGEIDQDAGISEAEYERQKKEIMLQSIKNKADAATRYAVALLEANPYVNEIGIARTTTDQEIEARLKQVFDHASTAGFLPEEKRDFLEDRIRKIGYDASGEMLIDKSTGAAIRDTTKDFGPMIEEIKRYQEALREVGEVLPKEQQKILDFYSAIAGVRGDIGGELFLARSIVGNKELKKNFDEAVKDGARFPKSLTDAIAEADLEQQERRRALGQSVTDAMNAGMLGASTETFRAGANHIVSALNQAVSAAMLSSPLPGTAAAPLRPWNARPVKKNALGGIYTSPILTEVAEAGDAEAIIPINGSQRAEELYRETGRLLGVEGSGGTEIVNHFNVNVTGDKSAARQAAKELYDTFVNYMEQYKRHEARVSY